MTESIGDFAVHGLIGLLGAVLLLEFFVRWKRNREIEPGILFLLIVAAILGIGAGAAYYISPTPPVTESAAAPVTPVDHWPAGCLFGLGVSAILAFYFKRRHRDIYLAEHERPTCFKTTVMKHRRHAVEGNMQLGYTAMLVLATASLGAAAFIGETKTSISTATAGVIASSESKDNSSKMEPGTMAELLAQVDNAIDTEPEAEPPTELELEPAPLSTSEQAGEMESATEIASTPAPEPSEPEQQNPTPAPEPSPPVDSMANRTPTIGKPQDFNPATKRPKNIPKNVFASHIRPILSKNCFSCHGSEKQKGGLRMDTLEGIRKGGKSGAMIVAGDPDRSTLYSSTILPADDPDIMPAKGDPLKKRDTELLRKWILFGADLGDGKHIADASSGGKGFAVDQRADGVPLPDAALIESLKADGVLIRAVSANQALLDLDFTHLENKNKLNLSRLAPIANNIHSLDLTRSTASDNDLATVSQMQNLVRLQLNRTSIGDEGLEHLKALTSLEILNLYSTKVTDAGLPHLVGLKKLQKLYLWESGATPEGADKLKRAIPKLKVIF